MKQLFGRGRPIAAAAATAIALLGVPAAGAQSIARPVATVHLHEPKIISSPQFMAFASMMARLRGIAAVQGEQCRPVLDALVDEHLIEQEAVERRLTPTAAEVDQQMVTRRRQIEEQLGTDRSLSDEQWRSVIQQQTGVTLEEYRDRLAAWVVAQRLVAQMRPGWEQEIEEPSGEDIQRFYDRSVQQLVQPDMALVLHIHFDTLGLDDSGVRQARARADDAAQELRDGAEFGDLVVKYSDDPSSRYRGGELGNRYLRRDDPRVVETLGTPFLETVFALSVGEVSPVVESNAGFHILKLADRLPARLLTLDDPIMPRSSQTVREQITEVLALERRAQATGQVVQEVVTELREAADIDVFENNLAAICPNQPS